MMNDILQKRIEKVAQKELEDTLEVTMSCQCANIAYEEFIQGVKYALSHQWISVDEALPPKEDNDSSITVLVHCQKGWCGIDYYRYKYDEWLNNGNSVTHWMPFPSLEGGEE